jgi:SAM-dependent methyltransferase
MNPNEDRRAVLRLAAVLSIYFLAGRSSHAGDSSTEPTALTTPVPASAITPTEQNVYAIAGRSNFRAIYGNPQLKAAFLLFLQNVFHLYPEDRLHDLIDEVTATAASDRQIYALLQARLPDIKPLLGDVTYAIPALWKQKAEMTRQTLALLGRQRRIEGYMELGTTGRYLSRLRSALDLSGDVVLVHSAAPSYSAIDIAEREQIAQIGRFVPMNDYAPISPSAIADESLDLVTNFIGFHHAPPAKRDAFVSSIHRILRRGGRLILRDHDVNSEDMNRMVALAHDVFNMGTGINWSVNQSEIRNFTSLGDQVPYLENLGFRKVGETLYQSGDPTHNALMEFVRA